MTTPLNTDEIRVSIEMGDEYRPTDRLRAALNELSAALAATETNEVEGFMGNLLDPNFRVLDFCAKLTPQEGVGTAGPKVGGDRRELK